MTRSPGPLAWLLLYSTVHRPPPRPPPLHLFSFLNRPRQLSSTAPLRAQAKIAVQEQQAHQEITYIHPHLDLMSLPPSLLPNWTVGEQIPVQGSSGSAYALTRCVSRFCCGTEADTRATAPQPHPQQLLVLLPRLEVSEGPVERCEDLQASEGDVGRRVSTSASAGGDWRGEDGAAAGSLS